MGIRFNGDKFEHRDKDGEWQGMPSVTGFRVEPSVRWKPTYGSYTYDLGPVKPLGSESDAHRFHDSVAAFLRSQNDH